MQTLLDAGCRKDVLNRLSGLFPDDKPKWGTMSAPQMIAHVSMQMKCALGINHEKPLNPIWRFWPLKKLVIYIVPWPHGLPTAESWKNPQRSDWNREMEQLQMLIREFPNKRSLDEWGIHPILGQLNKKDWGRLSYRHINHHLRQFGR
ncbi:MAG TPA: DUF1569 domain-containing protein [Balneolales bacterium]|nr:DUF1569 domain-containing protein [Balneolales bacterium]